MPTTKADAEKLVEMAKALPLPLKHEPLDGGYHIIDGKGGQHFTDFLKHEHAMPLVEVVNAAPQLAADYIALLEAMEKAAALVNGLRNEIRHDPKCDLHNMGAANAKCICWLRDVDEKVDVVRKALSQMENER